MLDAFAEDDDERIAGLDMRFEGKRPTKTTRRTWTRDVVVPPGAP